MYVPKVFREEDKSVLLAFLRRHSFATLVTVHEGEPFATHVPLLLSEDGAALRGHLARANPQFKDLAAGANVLAIFHGPHGYVSPSLYDDRVSVPTWNYAAVHAYGKPRLMNDAELGALLAESVTTFEAGRPAPFALSLPEDEERKKRAQIAGFVIEIARLEGKLKLSQNRTAAERSKVIADLEAQGGENQALAALMRENEKTERRRQGR